ncbi:Outer membrane protein assembly factor BamD, BamD/ComL family [Desulfacinum hydrothermale DSM 13146]|uniref:Outer membrane protein assembly factor BamD, BamD/ComL family n=1 Tax=Desulfacinum hydrothermale DSM 13146 TaxID=1121390 RepID=A0A1W1X5M5_9BACT|nr:tetratricopeptide repeat protein [Desulfacinum hydrothermale]SMC19212.1 Outer membrane protein assembly factor BamD, BamD/ComL family [Desulfacinum hydrothermale DSM 13146]
MEGERMVVMRPCLILVWFSLFLAVPVSQARTLVHDVRLGLHPGYTRLVLDCEGERPAKTYKEGQRSWIISFRDLQVGPSKGTWARAKKGVVERIQLDAPKIRVQLAESVWKARTFTLPATTKSNRGYRLVLDFFTEKSRPLSQPQVSPRSRKPNPLKTPKPRGQEKAAKQEKSPSETGQGPNPRRLPSEPGSALAAETALPSPSPTLPKGQGRKKEESAPQHSRKVSKPVLAKSLYGAAHEAFERLRQNGFQSPQELEQVVSLYQRALKTEPNDPQKPVALYRLGLCYLKAGNTKKAQLALQALVGTFESHPLARQAWIRLGELAQKEGNHVQALAAFDHAMEGRLSQQEATRLQYLRGISLLEAGDPQGARTAFEQVRAKDPGFEVRFPEIYRYLGEAAFALKDFQQSRRWLYQYLNVSPSIDNRDLVLARIAETYLHEGNREMADKLFAYIEAHYPGSEGDLVGRIRKAEYLEGQGPDLFHEAQRIYREMAEQPLPEPLQHLVQFKLAYGEWKEGRYRESLSRIDAILQKSTATTPFDEFQQLRQKVVLDWAKERHRQKNYRGVIELYETDPLLFHESADIQTLALVAESFEKLKFFPNALELYESVLQKDPQDLWRLRLARCAFETGQLDKAVQACRAITDASYARQKEEILGRTCAARQDWQGVLEHIGRIVEKADSVEPALLSLYAEAWYRTGRHDKALKWAQTALKALDQDRGDLFVSLSILASRCHLKLGQTDKALALLQKAVPQVDSDDLKNQLTYEIGMLYLETGKMERAEKTFSELLASPKELWKTAAKQQLDYLKIKKANSELF